jgi:hypothetical protein
MPLPHEIQEIIVGCALGDLHIAKPFANAFLRFAQSTLHSEYLLYQYSLLEVYCNSPPKTHTARIGNKGYRN